MEQKTSASCMTFKPLHSAPVHTKIESSPFSKDSTNQNFRGFLHLVILLFFVNMMRLVVENFRKYGWLLSLPGKGILLTDWISCLCIVSLLFFNITMSFLFESRLTRTKVGLEIKRLRICIVLNIASLLIIPSWIAWNFMQEPLLSSVALSLALILSMKLISYHVVNAELCERWKRHDGKDPYPDCHYPSNISLRNIYYFWLAPTLSYQPSYPKIAKFRTKFFIKRLLELAGSLGMIHFIIEQYALPTMKNSLKPLNEGDFWGLFERVLKLSISSLLIWLLGFYALFHSFLNIIAEVIGFGDRMFYQAWWNASSIDEYWRLWNAPVHLWLKRHVYMPLKSKGYSNSTAQFIIFLISAVAHEVLVAIPTKVFQSWAFTAMIMQIPLIYLSKRLKLNRPQSSAGNFMFWLCFCILGQPMVILLYYRAWASSQVESI